MATEANVGNRLVAGEQWPVPWAESLSNWLGDFAVELPSDHAIRRLDLLGILASHRLRDEPLHAWWEQALESALGHAKRTQRIVFFSSASPYADRLRHACSRFGVPYLELCRNESLSSSNENGAALLRCDESSWTNRLELPDSPIEDRAIAILSQQLFGLHVRAGGKIMQLIQARLDEKAMTPGATMVAVRRPTNTGRSLAAPLQLSRRGAVLWMLPGGSQESPDTAGVARSSWGCQPRSTPSTWMPCGRASEALLHSKDFLFHFTRARQGAWPGQSQSDLFDEAIRMEWKVRTPPLETLHRILVTQRLVASSYLRRGSMRTVCFTSNCLLAALRMREFQPHVGRWDWEPYGVAIRTSWLEAHGARPVRYLLPEQIHLLSQEEQCFAQPLPKDDRHRDWTVEQEWRVLDDIRLCQIPSDRAFLFVRSHKEASILSPWSRWPIVCLSSVL